MVQLHKTFGLTTLGLLFLFMVGWTSTAFSQEKGVKKMILKTIGENGVEKTQVMETELSKEDIFMRGPQLNQLKATPPGSRLKKVIMLGQGEQIPAHLQTEIEAMGIDINDLMLQFNAAEKSVRIYQEKGQPTTIEVDGGLSLELPKMQGQPQIRKRSMRMDGGETENTFEKNIDIDVDLQNIEGSENGTIKLNMDGDVQMFKFEGTEIPADIKQKLQEMGINLDVLGEEEIILDGNGQKRMMIIKTDEQEMVLPEGQQKMIWIDDENGEIDIEKGTKFEFKGDGGKHIVIKKDCEGNTAKSGEKATKDCCKGSGACCQNTEKARLGVFLEEGKGNGVIVQDVVAKSAAEEGGLQEGDVIIQVNKAKISSNQELINEIKKYQPGDNVSVKYLRNGKKQKVKVMLKAAARQKHRRHNVDMQGMFPRSPREAVDCEKACKTPMLGVIIHEIEGNGVRVSMTFLGSGAEVAGLQKGDIITKIGETETNSTAALINAVKASKPGDEIRVSYLRKGKAETKKVQLGSQSLRSFNPTCDCNNPDFMKSQEPDSKEIILVKPGAMEMPTMPQVKVESPAEPRLEIQKFELFPNPNQGTFTVSFQLDRVAPVTISVVDVTGKEIFTKNIADFNGSLKEQVDVSKSAKGIYFLNVIQGERVFSKQFVYN